MSKLHCRKLTWSVPTGSPYTTGGAVGAASAGGETGDVTGGGGPGLSCAGLTWMSLAEATRGLQRGGEGCAGVVGDA
jgi:hypothetical protein